jgi:hypothetical protein
MSHYLANYDLKQVLLIADFRFRMAQNLNNKLQLQYDTIYSSINEDFSFSHPTGN